MGERKGTNKYYPPDYDPKKGSLNAFLGTHALRERAKKIHEGILIIRFEMPYSIWCEGCGMHIGMGHRYNAEKKKVGNYYTTPIYQFRMKCDLCDQYFEIKTDPKNFDYEIVSGCKRQERRWVPDEGEMVEPTGKEEAGKLATDSMYKLEHGASDANKLKSVEPALEQLQILQDRRKDDYTANQILRATFREKRKRLKERERSDREYCQKAGLNIQLLPESDKDRQTASLIAQYRTRSSLHESSSEKRAEIQSRSIFSAKATTGEGTAPPRSTSKRKEAKKAAVAAAGKISKRSKQKHRLKCLASQRDFHAKIREHLSQKRTQRQGGEACSHSSVSLVSASYNSSDSD